MTEPGTAVQKVSMEDAAEKLRDKIKFSFAELIPDEQWTEMIKTELKKFMEPRTVRGMYNQPDRLEPSDFSKACHEIFQGILAVKLKEEVAKWSSWNERINPVVEEWVRDHGAEIIKAYMDSVLKGSLQNFVNTIVFPGR